jgi:hypothetical protein
MTSADRDNAMMTAHSHLSAALLALFDAGASGLRHEDGDGHRRGGELVRDELVWASRLVMLAQTELTTVARRLRDSAFVDAAPMDPFVGLTDQGDQR